MSTINKEVKKEIKRLKTTSNKNKSYHYRYRGEKSLTWNIKRL